MKKILFLGDSITDGGVYVDIIDAFLTRNNQYGKYLIDNIGLSSETVCGLTESGHPFPRPNVNERIEGILKHYSPNYAIVMYGINDGIYSPHCPIREDEYRQGLSKLVARLKQNGIEVLLCTPPVFDKLSCRSPMESLDKFDSNTPALYEGYDEVMERYTEIIKTEFTSKVLRVIDVHTAMKKYLSEKRVTVESYDSGDGIHPNAEMSYVMAECILREGFKIEDEIVALQNDRAFNKLFAVVHKRNTMVHKHHKETIGHSSPCKVKCLPMDKLSKVTAKLNGKISHMVGLDMSPKAFKWTKCTADKFHFHGYAAAVVLPVKANGSGSWILRTEFFGAFPAADKAALEQGYHLAYLHMPNMYGSPSAIAEFKEFYDHCKAKYQLSKKVLILGMSRGALSAVNFADSFPKLTQGLILDNGVVDIRSWPLGEMASKGELVDSRRIKGAYRKNAFGEEYAIELSDKLARLARNKIKIYLNANNCDDIVPYAENGLLIKEAYGESNPLYKEKINDGLGHHPHSNYDYREIIEWFYKE